MYNPYLEEYRKRVPSQRSHWSAEGNIWEVRRQMVQEFSWAIPGESALHAILAHGPVVEVGAGTGYWARCLAERGGDVIAYDAEPYNNKWCSGHQWYEVQKAPAKVAGNHPDRTLLLVWPPYEATMAVRAAIAYWQAGGKRIAYVGEGSGGCTASNAFHHFLVKRFSEQDDDLDFGRIPQWSGIYDRLEIWTRQ